jgi:hypothetical protein
MKNELYTPWKIILDFSIFSLLSFSCINSLPTLYHDSDSSHFFPLRDIKNIGSDVGRKKLKESL